MRGQKVMELKGEVLFFVLVLRVVVVLFLVFNCYKVVIENLI